MKNHFLEEVCPGIFRITERGSFGMLKPPVHIYVITGENGLVFDAGYGDSASIRKFSKAYKEISNICRGRGIENHIDRILPSHAHADHFSGLKKLRKKLGFRIILTDEMRKIISSSNAYKNSFDPPVLDDGKKQKKFLSRISKYINNRIEFAVYSAYWGISFVNDPDILINPNTEININDETWEIFSSPGHSIEHIILYNRAKGILFSGDNVLKSINVWLGPPKSDLDQYVNSIKKISGLPGLKIILPAHGGLVLNPYERLNEIVKWRKKRTDDVTEILENSQPGGLSIREILEILYPAETGIKKNFASGWVKLTLEKLVREKKIKCDKKRYFYSGSY